MRLALTLLPSAAQAKNCGRQPLGEGSGTSAGTVITRNLSCKRGISILDRWYERADKVCNRGSRPTARCVRGRRVARAEFGL